MQGQIQGSYTCIPPLLSLAEPSTLCTLSLQLEPHRGIWQEAGTGKGICPLPPLSLADLGMGGAPELLLPFSSHGAAAVQGARISWGQQQQQWQVDFSYTCSLSLLHDSCFPGAGA